MDFYSLYTKESINFFYFGLYDSFYDGFSDLEFKIVYAIELISIKIGYNKEFIKIKIGFNKELSERCSDQN